MNIYTFTACTNDSFAKYLGKQCVIGTKDKEHAMIVFADDSRITTSYVVSGSFCNKEFTINTRNSSYTFQADSIEQASHMASQLNAMAERCKMQSSAASFGRGLANLISKACRGQA